ncbi:choice-of-anchor D domain-containing protein [Persicimonas caeni]|uniref:choice-of-anchor D domain-containing protein n=1 Tax=Persicimonas caeni TaxID=2292766 RepID=UPI00143DA82C|nr:choice-of-anchor D domain-containing protein [Persicimonas caeni]
MLKYNRVVLLVALALVVGCSDDDSQVAPQKDVGGSEDAAVEADTGSDASGDAVDDVEEDAAEPAALRVTPTQLFFEGVEIGQTATETVRLANVGGSTLYINNAELTEGDPENDAELKPGSTWVGDDPLAIEPGTHVDLEVVYEPLDHVTDRGVLSISGTDPDNPQVEVAIETVSSYPDIDVLRTLRFGTVAVGSPATEEVVIHNRGISPLTVNEILMAGDSAFSLAMQAPYETPAVIEKDDYIIFEVTYNPSDAETDEATITIDSNDPDESSYEIGVIGNEPTPCIRVSSKSLDFGEVNTGARGTESLTILNCSETRQLQVSQIALSTDGGGAFTINQAPDTPVSIPPRTTEQVQVAASSDDVRDAIGVLVVESNDPQQGGLVVDLRASFIDE